MVNKRKKEFKALEPKEIKDKVMNFFESQRLEPESIYFIAKQISEEAWESVRINDQEDLANFFYDEDEVVDEEIEEDDEDEGEEVEMIDFDEEEEERPTRQKASKGVAITKHGVSKPFEEDDDEGDADDDLVDEVFQEQEEDIDSFDDLMNDVDEENSVAEQEEEEEFEEPAPKKTLSLKPAKNLPSLKKKKSNMVSK